MIVRADARHIPLRDQSVQCVVTSPPYWGLRDYSVAGQIGLEPTPDEYVAAMVGVFREVWRVLRDDGTVWLNLGSSYYSDAGKGGSGTFNGRNGRRGKDESEQTWRHRMTDMVLSSEAWRYLTTTSLKAKDDVAIPSLVALGLRMDGWYLRSDIIWAKPAPMPESVTDRPTRSHEYLFLLSKRERYFYDADAIREPWADLRNGDPGPARSKYEDALGQISGARRYLNCFTAPGCSGRNKRDVWTVNSEPTPEAHFATFPQKLIEPCILAGTSEKGCCAECGAPRVRETERIPTGSPASYNGSTFTRGKTVVAHVNTGQGPRYERGESIWYASCAHNAPSVPCVVCDPFLGSGTVGEVCERLGRRWVGLELSAPYIEIAKARTAQMGLCI